MLQNKEKTNEKIARNEETKKQIGLYFFAILQIDRQIDR